MTERPILFSGPMVRAILSGEKTQTRRVVKPQPPENALLVRYTGEHEQERLAHKLGWFVPAAGDAWPCNDKDRIPSPWRVGDTLWTREQWIYRGGSTSNQDPEHQTVYVEYTADGTRRDFLRPRDDDSGIPRQNMPERLQAARYVEPVTDEQFDLRMEYDAWLSRWWSRKRPSIFLPRWASRLFLRVTSVRCERLQDMSGDDAYAEGVERWAAEEDPRHSDGTPAKYPSSLAAFRALWDSLNDRRGFGWAVNPWVWVVEFERLS